MQQRHNGCRCRLGNTPGISSIPASLVIFLLHLGPFRMENGEEILTLYYTQGQRGEDVFHAISWSEVQSWTMLWSAALKSLPVVLLDQGIISSQAV